jgi:hypothetical protein
LFCLSYGFGGLDTRVCPCLTKLFFVAGSHPWNSKLLVTSKEAV